jgi:putative transposase
MVDNLARESLAIELEQGIKRAHVLDRIVAERGTPKSIRVDNGPEFVSWVLDRGGRMNTE